MTVKQIRDAEKYIDDELEDEEVEEYEDKMDEIMGEYSLKEFEKFLDKEKFKDTVQTYLKDKKLNEKQFFDALNNSQRFIEIIKK